ncbi:hypothetical protein DITRI_Ditri09bG0127100 [Diplodiscus trichospermus]
MEESKNKRTEEKLSNSISLANRVFSEVDKVKSFLEHWFEVGRRVDTLSSMLKTLLCFITAASAQKSLYLRPVDCILEEVEAIIKHALDVASKLNHKSIIILWLFNITKITDFQTLFCSLDDSIGNVKWLLVVYDPINNGAFEGIIGFLPPIVACNPFFLLVWSCIATVKMGRRLSDRIDAIRSLASLAQDGDLYKKYIVKEGGVPPLLKLFEETASLEAQIAAVDALCALTNDPYIIKSIEIVIIRLLKDAPAEAEIQAVNLVARMAEQDAATEYDSADESLIWRLVTLLSAADVDPEINSGKLRELKIRCAEALWMLAARSISNCRTITNTKAMLCLAKLVEKEEGKVKYYCLMTLMQITAAAESDSHFRHTVFKTNSPSSKAVVDQLVRVIEETNEPIMQIPAIRSIGSLARIFRSRDNIRVIRPLVSLLDDRHLAVATEAAIALLKFTSPENLLCIEHWKSVLEFISFPTLMRLIQGGNKLQRHRWVLNINKHAEKCLMRSISLSPLMTFIGVGNMILGYYSLSHESAHNQTDGCPAFSPERSHQEPCFVLCPVKL